MDNITKPKGKFVKGNNYYSGNKHSNYRGGITGNHKL